MYPKRIVVEDEEGGYYVAKLQAIDQIGTGHPIALYKHGQYHHTLHDAIVEILKEKDDSNARPTQSLSEDSLRRTD